MNISLPKQNKSILGLGEEILGNPLGKEIHHLQTGMVSYTSKDNILSLGFLKGQCGWQFRHRLWFDSLQFAAHAEVATLGSKLQITDFSNLTFNPILK